MDITEIRDQPLSSILCGFVACKHCGIVDRDSNRLRQGSPCSRCDTPSTGGYLFLPIQASAVVDLMQESYHTTPTDTIAPAKSESDHRLAETIFFITLGEVLLGHLLKELMVALNVPSRLRVQLLSDYPFARTRIEKLFPALSGTSWNQALTSLANKTGQDYRNVSHFYVDVADRRNTFLHTGSKWVLGDELPAECLSHTPALIELFVALHNEHVVPIYEESGREFVEAAV